MLLIGRDQPWHFATIILRLFSWNLRSSCNQSQQRDMRICPSLCVQDWIIWTWLDFIVFIITYPIKIWVLEFGSQHHQLDWTPIKHPQKKTSQLRKAVELIPVSNDTQTAETLEIAKFDEVWWVADSDRSHMIPRSQLCWDVCVWCVPFLRCLVLCRGQELFDLRFAIVGIPLTKFWAPDGTKPAS